MVNYQTTYKKFENDLFDVFAYKAINKYHKLEDKKNTFNISFSINGNVSEGIKFQDGKHINVSDLEDMIYGFTVINFTCFAMNGISFHFSTLTTKIIIELNKTDI
jgi:hypothetical protein